VINETAFRRLADFSRLEDGYRGSLATSKKIRLLLVVGTKTAAFRFSSCGGGATPLAACEYGDLNQPDLIMRFTDTTSLSVIHTLLLGRHKTFTEPVAKEAKGSLKLSGAVFATSAS
jgi:hypothetical protein